MGYLAGIFVTGIICITIYGLFELFARRKERIALIEKLTEIKNLGKIDGKINLTFGQGMSFWSLRGAGLLLGLGMGLFIGFLCTRDLVLNYNGNISRNVSEMIGMVYGGTILGGGGLGLLLAFIIERVLSKKEQE